MDAPTAALTPPRYAAGPLPAQNETTVGWEQALVDLHVDESGAVTTVNILRTTPGFADRLSAALGAWSFHPATRGHRPVPTDVLVAFVYRPPVLYNTPTIGSPSKTLAAPPATIPFPTATVTPMYPVKAAGDAVVLVEVQVSAAGTVEKPVVRTSASGFNGGARDAARQWQFRPAAIDGAPVVAIAYIAFGFRQPVTAPAPHRLSPPLTPSRAARVVAPPRLVWAQRTSIEKSTPSQRSTSGQ